MVFPFSFWLMLAACLLISAIGFKNYVWFISLGYGFSIAGEGLLMLLLYRNAGGLRVPSGRLSGPQRAEIRLLQQKYER